MYKDFKENYIEQQRQQAAARQARLAKIGMDGSKVATAKRAAPEAEMASAAQIKRQAPVRPNAPAYQQRRADTAVQRVQRPASAPEVRQQGRAEAAPVRAAVTPNTAKGTAETANRQPLQQSIQNKPAASTQTTPIRKAEPAPIKKSVSETQAPAAAVRPQTKAPERPAAVGTVSKAQVNDIRPVKAEGNTVKKAEPASRPAPTPAPANRPARTVSNGQSNGAHYNTRRQKPLTEEQIFKKELSDSESRAMMFALTGKAEQPDDGGDVDIINLGSIRAPKKKSPEKKKRSNVGRYIGRTFAVFGSLLLVVIIFVFSSIAVIAHGQSETMRDILVNSAMQASATKWAPYIFLSADTVDEILSKSEETVQDVVSLDDYTVNEETQITEDEWANAKDGMIFETVSGPTFKAYVLLVKDPSRIFVGTSQESIPGAKRGDDIFHITKFYGAVAAINGGEFPDNGGSGTGYTPIGLTYSKGKCINNDGHTSRTFLGITNDNKLVVNEGMTKAKADALGIRDAVSFQKGNTLIQQDGENLIFHYQDGNTGTAQRTGIGQRKDGTMILVVTDGRSASSLGATHNDMIDLMVSYGAVTAGLLDGGSSAMMYYDDFYNKYDGYDIDKLDKYQKQGLVNNYKAFTEPRSIPTYFVVKPE